MASTPRAEEVEGLVLCRVGDHQIAFPAAAVGHIELWEPGGVPAPLARAAFGLPASAGKLLIELVEDEEAIGLLHTDSLAGKPTLAEEVGYQP